MTLIRGFAVGSSLLAASISVTQPAGIRTINNIMAEYLIFNNLNDLEAGSDLILVGSPVLDIGKRLNHIKMYGKSEVQDYYTLTDFKIRRVIKGAHLLKRPSTKIIEPAALITLDGQSVYLTIDQYEMMIKDKEYLVFLGSNGLGGYSVINMNAGQFALSTLKTGVASATASTLKRRLTREIQVKYQFR